MVTTGKIRGNGSQLAGYLQKKADNDNVTIFDIRGTSHPNDLRKSLLEMSLTSELTKSDNGLYHAQINPRPGEDRTMTRDDWLKAAEIFEQELGYAGQKRVMVMHEKKGRLHMHVAWERYDHDKGIMISDEFSVRAQGRARAKMEKEFGHEPTQKRNKHRPILKEELTRLWQETSTAQDFIKAVEKKGYKLATGTKRPYRVIDHTGTSFDLIKQINGVRTKDVKQRFKGVKLLSEKQAIQAVRDRQDAEKTKVAKEKKVTQRATANDNDKGKSSANDNVKQSKPILTMSASFKTDHTDAKRNAEQMKQAIDQAEKRRLEKEKILQALKEESLRKAKEFNNNKKDMGR